MNSAGKIIPLKLTTKAEKTTRTTVDTIIVTPDLVRSWENPPFQRPLRVNDKVRNLAEKIREDGGVIPGVITLGVLGGRTYRVDGQHRGEAFILSECPEGFCDIRVHQFSTMAEMAEEFVTLNSSLSKFKPDDILRGMEASKESLQKIRKACPFVGYDMIRRGEKSPIVSMSTLLRCWFGSSHEVPATGGISAAAMAESLSVDDAQALIAFTQLAHSSWGRDAEYARLWGTLNLTLCMWLYRRTVITPYSQKTPKVTRDQFGRCLMSLSANSQYLDYLVGRQLRDRDRSPAYTRIKTLFTKRLEEEINRRALLPAPAWATHISGGR